MKANSSAIVITCCVWLFSFVGSAASIDTSFSYQGRLATNGVPTAGYHELKFVLYDSALGGSQMGPILTNQVVLADNGLFTVHLDFGPVFDGTSRWLEICVRTNGASAFQPLARQALPATPHALYALRSGEADTAVTAQTAEGVGPDSVGTLALQDAAVTEPKIGPGQVVKSINGLTDVVSFAAGIGLKLEGTTFGVAENGISSDLLSDGAVTLAKVSTNGALSGQSIFFDGTNAQWRTPSEGVAEIVAGPGLTGGGIGVATLAVEFAGSGSAPTAARSDHHHALDYASFEHAHSAADVTSGTLEDTRLSANVALLDLDQVFTSSNVFSGVVTATNEANQFGGAFHGNGGGLVNLQATGLAGTLSDEQLSSNVALLDSSPTFSGVVRAAAFAGEGGELSNVNAVSLIGPLTIENRQVVGHANNGGFARGVAVSGAYAYVANDSDGLRIYDVSDPFNPMNVGHIDDGGAAWAVTVVGDYAYLANQDDGWRIYDVSDPSQPVNAGHVNEGGQARAILVDGLRVYLANYNAGFHVYELSDPSHVAQYASTNNGGLALGVAFQWPYAYLANDADGLRVYDFPLRNVSHIDDGGAAKGVAVRAEYVYLANGDDGLRVYDVSEVTNPLSVGHVDDGGEARAIALNENLLYLANGNDGLRIYDISNPTTPANVVHIDPGGSAQGLDLANGYVFLANGADGLRICQYGFTEFRLDNQRILRVEANQEAPNLISGGSGSAVEPGAVGVSIGGGNSNNVSHSSSYSAIGGGLGNLIGFYTSDGIYPSADFYPAAGRYSTIGGGVSNEIALVDSSWTEPREGATIGGGVGNKIYAYGSYCTISGGWDNFMNDLAESYNSIGGGAGNAMYEFVIGSTIAGGVDNAMYDCSNCGIAGGAGNLIESGGCNNIDGGWRNVMPYQNEEYSSWCSSIGGGERNLLFASYSTIGGGFSNTITRLHETFSGATIGGGRFNEIVDDGDDATVGGGFRNRIQGQYSTISGGLSNATSTAVLATIGGGGGNSIEAACATISGGSNNSVAAASSGSSIAGGLENAIRDSYSAVIGGGMGNIIGNTIGGGSATIGGGSHNSIDADHATIGGGSQNSVEAYFGTIAGGAGNKIGVLPDPNPDVAQGSTIGGGGDNVIMGYYSTIAGGGYNRIERGSNRSTIGGGHSNMIGDARMATIPGGLGNVISDGAHFSLAAGCGARSDHRSTFVWADSLDPNGYSTTPHFSSGTNNEFAVRATGGVRFVSGIDTNGAATAGVQLPAGGTGWSVISDRNMKENFEPVDGREVLKQVAAMPIQQWNMKSQDPSIRHIGPMAQDFHAAFGVGENNRHINTVDADGVALAAIQGLNQKVEEQAAQIQELRKTIEELNMLLRSSEH